MPDLNDQLSELLRRAEALKSEPTARAQKKRKLRLLVKEIYDLAAERLGEAEAAELFEKIASR